MKNYKSLHRKRSGTSFKGYAIEPYHRIVEIFGEPNSSGDGYKVDIEWVIDTPYGVATIYNYKDGKAYLGNRGLEIQDITDWHIGGKNDLVCIYINARLKGMEVSVRGLTNQL